MIDGDLTPSQRVRLLRRLWDRMGQVDLRHPDGPPTLHRLQEQARRVQVQVEADIAAGLLPADTLERG